MRAEVYRGTVRPRVTPGSLQVSTRSRRTAVAVRPRVAEPSVTDSEAPGPGATQHCNDRNVAYEDD